MFVCERMIELFCKKCGSQVPDGMKFCAACGTPAPVRANAPATMSAPSTPPVQNQGYYQQPNTVVMVNNAPVGRPVSKVAYVLLAFFLGGFGIHNFYAGKTGLGILYLLFCWTFIPELVALIQGFVALFKKSDANGQIYV